MYFRNIINVYSLFLHEWWISLIKFMVGSTIHVRWKICIYGTPGVPNNFPIFLIILYSLSFYLFIIICDEIYLCLFR